MVLTWLTRQIKSFDLQLIVSQRSFTETYLLAYLWYNPFCPQFLGCKAAFRDTGSTQRKDREESSRGRTIPGREDYQTPQMESGLQVQLRHRSHEAGSWRQDYWSRTTGVPTRRRPDVRGGHELHRHRMGKSVRYVKHGNGGFDC